MHIALYSPAWPANESPNGIVTYVHILRKELIRQGHRVSVFSRLVRASNQDSEIYHITPCGLDKLIGKLKAHLGFGLNYSPWGRYAAASIREVHAVHPIDVVEMEDYWGWCGDVQK